MSFSTTSTPAGKSLGTQDNSRVPVNADPKQSSMTMTLIPILAKKGRSKATIVTNDAAGLYGAETFQKDSPYFTHANLLLAENAALGVPSLVKRILPEGAEKALFRLSAEIIATDLPAYERNSDGSIKQQTDPNTGVSSPVSNGSIQGTRVVLHVGVGPYIDGARKFKQANIIDDYRDGSTAVAGKFLGEITRSDGSKEHPKSRLIPLFDLEVDSEGDYGNNLGLAFSVPTLNQADPAVASDVISNKAFPLRVTVLERANKTASPFPYPMISQDYTFDYYLKARAVDSISGRNVSFAKQFVSNYTRKQTAELTPVWGPFGDVHVYERNIQELQQILAEGYVYTDTDGGEVQIKGERDFDLDAQDFGSTSNFTDPLNYGLLNFLTAKDLNGVPYFATSVSDSMLFGGVVIDAGAVHYASGGNDGLWFLADGSPAELLNLKVFDDGVQAFFKNFGSGEDTLKDILRYPFTNVIDSGYSMDTKFTLSNVLTARPDVVLIVGTKSVAEKGVLPVDIGPVYRGNSVDAPAVLSADLLDTWDFQPELNKDQDLAMAVKLRTHFGLFPESTFFGTPVMRVIVCGSSGYDVKELYPHQLPGSVDRGLAANLFTQVTRWSAADDLTENDNRKPRFLKDMVYHWREETGYDQAWDAGMNFLRSHDVADDFWPALQTIYTHKDSVLASAKFAFAAARCHYFGMEVWRSISGENKTDLQFKQDLEDEANRLIENVFTDDITVVPVALLTEADKARGYSGQLKFHIGIGSMRTKLTYSVHGWKAEQLSQMQGLLGAQA